MPAMTHFVEYLAAKLTAIAAHNPKYQDEVQSSCATNIIESIVRVADRNRKATRGTRSKVENYRPWNHAGTTDFHGMHAFSGHFVIL